MGEWIASCCDVSDPEAREEATPLYQHFRQFCIDRGDNESHIMSQTSFGRQLTDAQIYAVANNATGKKERVGIRLKRADELGGGALTVGGGSTFAGDVERFDLSNPDPFGAL